MSGTTGGGPDGLGVDLHLELGAGGSRRALLIGALREAVRGGRLAPGTRLPPYRSLAADLGIARNTVADAYAELVAEGWLTSRQGSGTRVAEQVSAPAPGPVRPAAPPPLPYDLVQGKPDPGAFPRAAWLAAARRALTAAPHEAFGTGDPRGRIELRRALAAYLARVRGVRTTPDRIVVCSGTAHALRLLARVTRGTPPPPWAVEAYGLPFHRGLFGEAGVGTVPVTVDGDGARIAEIPPEAGAVLLTPAHQFPTGGPLHPERRAGVLEWARRTGGLVVEDDYDGEFRYDRRPVGAVQGLDPERTVFLGSLSKSLSPALRIGWMCLPTTLVDGVVAAKGVREPYASATEQLTFADFLDSGAYDRHVRRMRQRHRVRRDRLVSVLAERVPGVRVTGLAAGLHAVVELPPGTERSAVTAAARHGVAVEGLSDYRHPEARGPALPDGLVVGYATPPERLYGAALDALCDALCDTLGPTVLGAPAGPSS
ncbi:PLP-dependent aminotransferase family protein [Streptomyces sp. NBC_00094]|uniref:MocR-like pyridoxine biosynthesis transcription factor PdxR n=1 Tax=Streptomyces sp. NBC_00094 TaxID=2903620 RepID=UPI002252B04D|nr:PLP-dependent aminotransferase family protein [Streptomyces sp. NBC_00094]MCX5390285.1 PLP-dependent aminotransferase family protein [Streptomyces sp. NBC_00094]